MIVTLDATSISMPMRDSLGETGLWTAIDQAGCSGSNSCTRWECAPLRWAVSPPTTSVSPHRSPTWPHHAPRVAASPRAVDPGTHRRYPRLPGTPYDPAHCQRNHPICPISPITIITSATR